MSGYHTHQEITSRLKALSDQLSQGNLSEEELKEFETLSRRIYERAIVLNYKAKEAHVYSKSVSKEIVEEENSSSEENEESNSDRIEKPAVSEKAPVESGEIAFDFSSSESDEEPAVSVSQTKQEEIIQEEESSEQKDQVQEQKPAATEDAPETPKEVVVPEEKVNSFFERLTKVHDDSLMSKLGASKLDTLKGAIGLNDKMQFISELFNGNADLFNETIDKLDTQESNEKARHYLSEIAVKQSWDAEDPLVEEFVRILDRRYAE